MSLGGDVCTRSWATINNLEREAPRARNPGSYLVSPDTGLLKPFRAPSLAEDGCTVCTSWAQGCRQTHGQHFTVYQCLPVCYLRCTAT